MNVVLLLTLETMPRAGFLSWGWRIPFVVGVLLGLVYLWQYRKVVEDTTDADRRRAAGARQPVVELFTEHRALIGSVFLFTCGYWFATQMSVSFLPHPAGAGPRTQPGVLPRTRSGSVLTIGRSSAGRGGPADRPAAPAHGVGAGR